MTTSPAARWFCLSTGHRGATCDTTGTTQASAQKHVDQIGHVTITHVADWRRDQEVDRAS